VAYAVPNPLTGYRELNDVEVALVELIKRVERDVLSDLWRQVRDADTSDREGDPTFNRAESGVEVDPRWLEIAHTHFQEGMSALVRSVTRPAEVYDT
jgi:hypothetical protein